MAVTGAIIRAALSACGAVGGQIRGVDELAAGADTALRQAPGLTADGAAGFLATVLVESGWFRTTEEYQGARASYAPYFGRTFIQITHKSNYADFGAWARRHGLVADANVFVSNPAALGDFRWAWLGPIQYMEAHGLWAYANRGDFRGLSQGVNGGNGRIGTGFTPNGWKERQAAYNVFRGVGAALLPSGASAPAAVVPAPEPPRRRSRREPRVLYFKSPEPAAGLAKKDWPTILVPYAFDPLGGWGGRCVLKVDWFGRGGWLKAGQWWVRDPNWNANRPTHFPVNHPVGPAGSERFVGYGWETAPPLKADSIQITASAPDGLVIQVVYEK